MRVEEYVAARYGRLLEHAVMCGAPEGLAAQYVDQVLVDLRKQIRRAEDPDPVVMAALERAIGGETDEGRGPLPFVVAGLVVIAIAAAVALSYQPRTDPMPGLFGYTGQQAKDLLERDGYAVVLRPIRECEPLDQVLGSEPGAGKPLRTGAVVSVFTAVPSGSGCEATSKLRSEAWDFLGFAVSGSSEPRMARTVTVVVDGVRGEPRSGVGAASSPRWEAIRRLIADYAQQPAGGPIDQSRVSVSDGVPPATTCAQPKPAGAADRTALRIVVDARAVGERRGCPLTLDLYRDSARTIDGLVIYSAVDPSVQ